MEQKMLTIEDVCRMHGGLVVAKRHIDYTVKNVMAACDEYDATDCNDTQFLLQCACALENIDAVMEALEFVESAVKTMRAQVVPNYSEGEDEE